MVVFTIPVSSSSMGGGTVRVMGQVTTSDILCLQLECVFIFTKGVCERVLRRWLEWFEIER